MCVGAAAPAHAATTPASPPALRACGDRPELKSALDRVTGEIALAGAAVWVVDPACGRWGYASGTADLRTGRPMDVRDRLRIGSITKTFTAATVLQLVDEGRLSLDDRLGPDGRYGLGLITEPLSCGGVRTGTPVRRPSGSGRSPWNGFSRGSWPPTGRP